MRACLSGFALCAVLALSACHSGSSPPPRRASTPPPPPPPPNILFILADDLGAEATSVYPSLAGTEGQAPMPTIEALAADGIVFDNAWANPVCSPTRGTIISGLYGHRTGVTYVGDVLPTATTTSIFEMIASSSPESYAMAAFGKWHLGPDVDHIRSHGVPEFLGFPGGGISDYFDWTYQDLDGNSTATTTYSTTAITDFAIEFIANLRLASDAPWFIYLAYNAPHGTGASTGFQVPPVGLHSVDVGGLPPGTIEDTVPVYQAMIQALDTEIGRLLDAISPVGSPERDRTIVIFMGDNGTPAAVKDFSAGVRGYKSTVFEGGVRVPLIISGDRVARRGVREDELVVATDMYATIAELAGISLSSTGDSFSLAPLLTNPGASSGRTLAFTEMCTFQSYYAIRNERYKLSLAAGDWGLYDLQTDLDESSNLFGDAFYTSERIALEAELESLKQAATDGCFL